MDEADDSLDISLSDEDVCPLNTKSNIVDLNSWLKQLPTVAAASEEVGEVLHSGGSNRDVQYGNGAVTNQGPSLIPSAYSSLRSQKSGKGDTLNSRGKRRVKIVVDINADKDSSTFYRIHEDAVTSVPYNSVTWDSMVQNLRIALQMNSLFLCDSFLGAPKAHNLYQELLELRDNGFFDLHMRSSAQGVEYQYACACLTQPEVEHSRIDGLALIFYKLAMYYTKQWKGIRVNVLYFPNGMESRRYKATDGDHERTLTCLYYCTEGLQLAEDEGSLVIKAADHRDMKAESRFDRLVAFWETPDDNTTLNYITHQVFLINMVLKL